jgi:hypothetical protein
MIIAAHASSMYWVLVLFLVVVLLGACTVSWMALASKLHKEP